MYRAVLSSWFYLFYSSEVSSLVVSVAGIEVSIITAGGVNECITTVVVVASVTFSSVTAGDAANSWLLLLFGVTSVTADRRSFCQDLLNLIETLLELPGYFLLLKKGFGRRSHLSVGYFLPLTEWLALNSRPKFLL